ncbi:hypothetical protein [Methyloversatilis discipulorum]|uniref:hypothetical protein n=1 Tax=Methyloversatilis discipulorum TaxID=1119528 RepID=UPI003AF81AB1
MISALPGHVEDLQRLNVCSLGIAFEDEPPIAVIHQARKIRRNGDQLRPGAVEQDEMIKLDQSATAQSMGGAAGSDADPGEFVRNTAAHRFGTDPADANDSVKFQISDAPHAVVNAKATQPVRIAGMGALVG